MAAEQDSSHVPVQVISQVAVLRLDIDYHFPSSRWGCWRPPYCWYEALRVAGGRASSGEDLANRE